MTQYQFVGIDVAKDKFDVAVKINDKFQQQSFSNNLKGYQALMKWLTVHTTQPWICMEATGHYSELIADYLSLQEVKVSVVNPLQIKNFARAKLTRNKTDQLDARIIAQYVEMMLPRTFKPRTDAQKELRELMNLLDTLKLQHVQLVNQLHVARMETAKEMLRKLIKAIEKEMKKVEEAIAEIIKRNAELNENMRLITSIKGVGKLTAYKVLSHAPDMGNFRNAKQFAAYIGISPRQHQSGSYQGKTTISRLGNATLRKIFYMAALVAKRHNTRLQPFVTRLRTRGKAPKEIICAVMRKLAHYIFGVLKNRRPFDANFA